MASRKQDGYPRFDELRALADARPSDVVDGLRAATNLLSAVIRVAAPTDTAVIRLYPTTTRG